MFWNVWVFVILPFTFWSFKTFHRTSWPDNLGICPCPSFGKNIYKRKWPTVSGVRRKFPRGGPKHGCSQGRAIGAMPPPKFVENIVILCFERRFSKDNNVIRLKLNILLYTAEYWQYTLLKTVYTFFIFRVWGVGHGTVATPLHTLVPTVHSKDGRPISCVLLSTIALFYFLRLSVNICVLYSPSLSLLYCSLLWTSDI